MDFIANGPRRLQRTLHVYKGPSDIGPSSPQFGKKLAEQGTLTQPSVATTNE